MSAIGRIAILVATLTGGCAFDPSAVLPGNGETSDGGSDGGSPVPDADLTGCTPGTQVCVGRNLETCDDSSDGLDEGATVVCDFTCSGDRCVVPSNIPAATAAACDDTAPALRPPIGATITVTGDDTNLSIDCAPSCDQVGATTTIASSPAIDQGGSSILWFCLSRVDIPSGVLVEIENTATAVAFFVDGPVSMNGSISVNGSGANSTTPGPPGPGGGGGGDNGNNGGGSGDPGLGPCGGEGGEADGSGGDYGAGAGGGGGGLTDGGRGGNGRNPSGSDTGSGGSGGSACMTAELIPLIGGSGGGGGADGTCGGTCAWPGGGGGGALQITSRTQVSYNGKFDGTGGTGYGTTDPDGGGGGGGGAGGGLLIEAPLVSIGEMANLAVLGGAGGASGAGDGGPSGATGVDATGDGDGGSGGGGGAGAVRVNSENGASCSAQTAPTSSCSTGPLRTQP